MKYPCDGCQQLSAVKPGLCARCARPQCDPKHPGVLRVLLGCVAFYGGVGAFDQTPLTDAALRPELWQSLHLIWVGAVLSFWGVHRIQRGPTRQSLRGYFALFIAKRYLRRAYAHQRRMGRVL